MQIDRQTWPVTRVLLLLVMGGCLTLMADVRFEHADKVGKFPAAWIPIVYAGVMALLSLWCLIKWTPLSRRVLFWLFSLGMAVGLLGMWLHTDGHMIDGTIRVLSAWFTRVHHEDEPPQLAPLAFCGIGMMGMLACARPFHAGPANDAKQPL